MAYLGILTSGREAGVSASPRLRGVPSHGVAYEPVSSGMEVRRHVAGAETYERNLPGGESFENRQFLALKTLIAFFSASSPRFSVFLLNNICFACARPRASQRGKSRKNPTWNGIFALVWQGVSSLFSQLTAVSCQALTRKTLPTPQGVDYLQSRRSIADFRAWVVLRKNTLFEKTCLIAGQTRYLESKLKGFFCKSAGRRGVGSVCPYRRAFGVFQCLVSDGLCFELTNVTLSPSCQCRSCIGGDGR